jgi:hypothetical protein
MTDEANELGAAGGCGGAAGVLASTELEYAEGPLEL